MRTDADRRSRLKLDRLRRERDDLAHERGLLRVQLAAIAGHRSSGWRGPEAIELRSQIQALTARWSAANEALRAVLQERV